MYHSAATPEAMLTLGRHFALSSKAGDLFALCGGLGAGKTHWTKGFLAGLDSPADVTSPTFGLLHEYPNPTLTVYHFDFYRMKSEDEVTALGWDEILEQNGIVIVEWADLFPHLFPQHTQWLRFTINEDGTREIERCAHGTVDAP